jgi:hypothetical protein
MNHRRRVLPFPRTSGSLTEIFSASPYDGSMRISKIAGQILGAVVTISALAGCEGSQVAVPQSATQARLAATGFASRITPDRKGQCGGTHHVRVRPCPVNLTAKTKHGITVTVSGPGVSGSTQGYNGCAYQGYCDVQQLNGTQYLITSGADCGNVLLEFSGNNASGQSVGIAFLTVRNEYCSQ